MLRQPINWSKHTTHGRANEITEISTILKQIDQGAPSRVVAITGPSGVGKVWPAPSPSTSPSRSSLQSSFIHF